jgi:hypothetical protein
VSKLATWLWKACAELGLRVELGFGVTLGEGRHVRAIARLPDLGAPKGMLLFQSYDQVREFAEELRGAGYGYSVLDEPPPAEQYDSQAFRTVFRDWGWSGELGKKPAWMR